MVPDTWKANLINTFLERNKHKIEGPVPACIRKGAYHLTDPYCVAKASYMAHLEMERVRFPNIIPKKTRSAHI